MTINYFQRGIFLSCWLEVQLKRVIYTFLPIMYNNKCFIFLILRFNILLTYLDFCIYINTHVCVCNIKNSFTDDFILRRIHLTA